MVDYCAMARGHPVHQAYHDTEYGFPSRDENVLFERLSLEIMQAGLSWEIVLKKRAALARAFKGFDPERVAAFDAQAIEDLLADPSIIRNRRKIEAIVANAAIVMGLRATHGGFAPWLDAHHPSPRNEWTRLFKKTFRFTGGEIVGEFLTSLGYLEGAHVPTCPVYGRVAMARRRAKKEA